MVDELQTAPSTPKTLHDELLSASAKCRYASVIELAERLLLELENPHLRTRVLLERARAFESLGAPTSTDDDINHATEIAEQTRDPNLRLEVYTTRMYLNLSRYKALGRLNGFDSRDGSYTQILLYEADDIARKADLLIKDAIPAIRVGYLLNRIELRLYLPLSSKDADLETDLSSIENYIDQIQPAEDDRDFENLNARFSYVSGLYKLHKGEVKPARKLFRQAHELYLNVHNYTEAAETAIELGMAYFDYDHRPKALWWFMNSLYEGLGRGIVKEVYDRNAVEISWKYIRKLLGNQPDGIQQFFWLTEKIRERGYPFGPFEDMLLPIMQRLSEAKN